MSNVLNAVEMQHFEMKNMVTMGSEMIRLFLRSLRWRKKRKVSL